MDTCVVLPALLISLWRLGTLAGRVVTVVLFGSYDCGVKVHNGSRVMTLEEYNCLSDVEGEESLLLSSLDSLGLLVLECGRR